MRDKIQWNTRVMVAKCPVCSDEVFSRYRTDLRWCGCTLMFVTGDPESPGIGFKQACPEDIEISEVLLPITAEQLYIDCATGADRFGIIRNRKDAFYGV